MYLMPLTPSLIASFGLMHSFNALGLPFLVYIMLSYKSDVLFFVRLLRKIVLPGVVLPFISELPIDHSYYLRLLMEIFSILFIMYT